MPIIQWIKLRRRIVNYRIYKRAEIIILIVEEKNWELYNYTNNKPEEIIILISKENYWKLYN